MDRDWPKEGMKFARRNLPEIMSSGVKPEAYFKELAKLWEKHCKPGKAPKSSPKSDSGTE